MKHILKVKIYYEDTDCGGVVYYANYLRYAERARTEFIESGGVSLKRLMDEKVYFVVAEAALKYFSPGRYGDVIVIETTINKIGTASVLFSHRMLRDSTDERLADVTVKLGCVGPDMKPLKLSPVIKDALTGLT